VLFLGVAGIFGPACGIPISPSSMGRQYRLLALRVGVDERNIYGAHWSRFLPQGFFTQRLCWVTCVEFVFGQNVLKLWLPLTASAFNRL